MAKLLNTFTKEVSVPDWEYCNEHYTDEPNRIGTSLCDFISKNVGDYYCRLFGGLGLYQHDTRILKCEECLGATGEAKDGN